MTLPIAHWKPIKLRTVRLDELSIGDTFVLANANDEYKDKPCMLIDATVDHVFRFIIMDSAALREMGPAREVHPIKCVIDCEYIE